MKLDKGLISDNRTINKENGSWNTARNVVLSSDNKSIINEKGCINIKNHDLHIIGTIKDDLHTVIFSTNNTISEIGVLDSFDVYTTVIRSTHLKLKIENPVSGVSKRNFKDEVIINWVDGLGLTAQAPCILNITKLPFTLNNNKELVNPKEINKIFLSPSVNVPVIIGSTIYNTQGRIGNIIEGSIQFAIAYYINETETTEFIYVSHPFHNSKKGNSLKVTLSNLDTTYKKYKVVAILKTETDIIVNYVMSNYTTLTEFTYTGQDLPTNLTLEKLLISTIKFKKVQSITNLNKELLYANYITNEHNYQCYANNIKVKWGVSRVRDNVYPPSGLLPTGLFRITGFDRGTFKPNEVYAFYIALINNDGSESKAFHIPGRKIKPHSSINVHIPLNVTIPQYMLDDPITYNLYTSDYYSMHIDINGKLKIHITPSFSNVTFGQILSNSNNEKKVFINSSFYEIESVVIDTPVINNNYTGLIITFSGTYVTIPESVFGDCAIFYTVTDAENAYINGGNDINSVDFNELRYYHLHDTSTYNGGDLGYWENNNERYGDSDEFNVCDDTGIIGNIKKEKVRHHRMPTEKVIKDLITTNGDNQKTFYLEFNNIHIPNDIKKDIQGYKIYYALKENKDRLIVMQGRGVATRDNRIAKPGGNLDSDWRFYSFEGFSYKPYINSKLMYLRSNTSSNRFGLSDTKYLPQGNGIGNPNREEHIHFTMDYSGVDILANIETVKEDVHANYNNQVTVPTNRMTKITNQLYQTSDKLFSGDTRINIEHFTIHSHELPDTTTGISFETHSFLTNGSYIDNTNFEVRSRFSTVNNLKPLNTSIGNTTNKFPTRISRSLKNLDEATNDNWRIFPPNNYYDMPRKKGDIRVITSTDNAVYIQHDYTLYFASIKDTLNSFGVTTYLGVGDVFDRQPDEIVNDDDGYIGCQSKFGVTINKFGYFVVDLDGRRVFLINGIKPKEISINKVEDIFNQINAPNSIDNPYNNNGVSVAFDEVNEVFLITNTKGLKNLTISYKPSIDIWVSFHDYIGSGYFTTRGNLYSVLNKNTYNIYKHNIGEVGLFYNGLLYPSSIDLVFSENNEVSKVFNSVTWVSDSLKTNNTVVLQDTITHVMLYNNYQCSGLIPIQLYKTWFNEIKNVKEESWFFNKFNDVVVNRNLPFIDKSFNTIISNLSNNQSWFNKSKFISKFIVVRLQYDNKSQNRLYINSVKINKRKSHR